MNEKVTAITQIFGLQVSKIKNFKLQDFKTVSYIFAICYFYFHILGSPFQRGNVLPCHVVLRIRVIGAQVNDLHGLMMRGVTQDAATPAFLLVQTEASIACLKQQTKAAKLTVKAQAVEAKAVAKAAAKTAAANARAAAKAAAQEAKKAAAAEKEKEKIQGAIRDR